MNERDLDALIERALWGLSPEDEASLADRLGDAADAATPRLDAFDGAVGAAAVAMSDANEALPADLGASLRALGRGFAAARAAELAPPPAAVQATPRALKLTSAGPAASSERGSIWGALGWMAAAACLTFALLANQPTPAASSETRLASLERDADDLVRAAWAGLAAIGAPNHALDRGVAGEVIWSDARDEGFMRISGIEPNDPAKFQYQLWIFDSSRRTGDLPQFRAEGLPEILTQRPVDGGVFDVTDAGGTLVPIDAKLPIGKGVLFAVTKEAPGGVVVSDREIVFLALRG